MNFINFTQHFQLPIIQHRGIDFVDVPVNTDVKLFLDPGLIEAGRGELSQKCSAIIRSYFECIFNCCRAKDFSGLSVLLQYSSEPNETHLGNSVARSQGRGASEDILFTMFKGMVDRGLFECEAVIHPCDICVLAPNFDKDRMSDLLTNILRNPLSEFTVLQCNKHGVPLSGLREGPFWEPKTKRWNRGEWYTPVVSAQPVMLVPKSFVGRSYHFGTSSYISRYLLEYRQKYHLDNRTSLCYEHELKDGKHKITPPTKKDLKAKELCGRPWKQHAADFALANPNTMHLFGIERQDELSSGAYFMTDHELDVLLYPDWYKIA